MDYRKFLGKKSTRVLPYFGGTRVHDLSRALRMSVEQPPGWYEFEISGRTATPLDRVEAPDLAEFPPVRGHFALGWVFAGGRELERVELLPSEEPPVFSPIVGRRWPSGHLVFGALEFETEVEDSARRALEEERGIDDLKGVGASLRAAFGFALAARVGERLDVPISAREAMRAVLAIAAQGRVAADALLGELAEERRLERVRIDSFLPAEARSTSGWRQPEERASTPVDRAIRALDSAGAELSGYRSLDNGMMEITYRYLGERFISVVDERTLQVIDAGICLSGSDRMVTLESLPSVIREGYDTGQLNITRR